MRDSESMIETKFYATGPEKKAVLFSGIGASPRISLIVAMSKMTDPPVEIRANRFAWGNGIGSARRIVQGGFEKIRMADALAAMTSIKWAAMTRDEDGYALWRGPSADPAFIRAAQYQGMGLIKAMQHLSFTARIDRWEERDFRVAAWDLMELHAAIRRNGDQQVKRYEDIDQTYLELVSSLAAGGRNG